MSRAKVLWILAGVLALGYVVAGLSRISFNVDILRLLPSHLHQVGGLSLFLKNFALPNELIVTIDAPDSESAEVAAGKLAAAFAGHPELVKAAVARPPWETDPASLSEFLTFLMINQPVPTVAGLLTNLDPANSAVTLRTSMETLETSLSPQEIALRGYDPFGLTTPLASESGLLGGAQKSEFSSGDGLFRVVYLEAARPFANYKEIAKWLAEVQKIATAAVAGTPITLGFTGEPAFVAEISTGMEWDMATSAFATLVLISLIFWLCYGQVAPLRWLMAMLLLTFVFSLATAGLFLNELTVIGAGFASVMIGLSVDYGYLIYQQSLRHQGSVGGLQWQCLQNIAWTSTTTAAAFFALNLSSLPGLSQLGSMVGLGVCIGALVMLGVFAPLAMRMRHGDVRTVPSRLDPLFASRRFAVIGTWFTVGMVVILLATLVIRGFPAADFSASTFRARHSGSQSALENLYRKLSDDRGLLSLIVSGRSESEVLTRLRDIRSRMDTAIEKGDAVSFLSPLPMWPDVERQKLNLAALAPVEARLPELKSAVLEAGFTEEAFGLTRAVIGQVAAWQSADLPVWPENPTSRWILRRMARHEDGNYLALGMVEPVPGRELALSKAFEDDGVYLVSWGALGEELRRTMPREIVQVSLGLLGAILLILSIGLRSARAILLFAVTTALVLVCLAGAMSLLGMTWGFFNLAAVLLLLGTGTDYSILLLLALRRNGGDTDAARRKLGLVIFLCCTSAAAGFGSLGWAGNSGLAALGKTCALGLLIDGLISLFLLPRAWDLIHGEWAFTRWIRRKQFDS